MAGPFSSASTAYSRNIAQRKARFDSRCNIHELIHFFTDTADEFVHNLIFRRKMIIECALRDTCGLTDLHHGNLIIAIFLK